MGIAWHPSGRAFYVAGGLNDNVHVFEQQGTEWVRAGDPISLGHTTGLGIGVAPLAAGVAVNGNGTRLLVANLENDSVSLVNLEQRAKIWRDRSAARHALVGREGVPGGEFPLWVVIKGNDKAYVSSLRDREIVVLDLADDQLPIKRRIRVPRQSQPHDSRQRPGEVDRRARQQRCSCPDRHRRRTVSAESSISTSRSACRSGRTDSLEAIPIAWRSLRTTACST